MLHDMFFCRQARHLGSTSALYRVTSFDPPCIFHFTLERSRYSRQAALLARTVPAHQLRVCSWDDAYFPLTKVNVCVGMPSTYERSGLVFQQWNRLASAEKHWNKFHFYTHVSEKHCLEITPFNCLHFLMV